MQIRRPSSGPVNGKTPPAPRDPNSVSEASRQSTPPQCLHHQRQDGRFWAQTLAKENILHVSRSASYSTQLKNYICSNLFVKKTKQKTPNKQQQQNLSKHAERQKSKPSLAQISALLRSELSTSLEKEGLISFQGHFKVFMSEREELFTCGNASRVFNWEGKYGFNKSKTQKTNPCLKAPASAVKWEYRMSMSQGGVVPTSLRATSNIIFKPISSKSINTKAMPSTF